MTEKAKSSEPDTKDNSQRLKPKKDYKASDDEDYGTDNDQESSEETDFSDSTDSEEVELHEEKEEEKEQDDRGKEKDKEDTKEDHVDEKDREKKTKPLTPRSSEEIRHKQAKTGEDEDSRLLKVKFPSTDSRYLISIIKLTVLKEAPKEPCESIIFSPTTEALISSTQFLSLRFNVGFA